MMEMPLAGNPPADESDSDEEGEMERLFAREFRRRWAIWMRNKSRDE